MNKVDQMCEIFGISRSALITSDYPDDSREQDPLTEEEAKLISAYRSASEEIKTAACAVLGITRKKESSTSSAKIG